MFWAFVGSAEPCCTQQPQKVDKVQWKLVKLSTQ